MHPPLEEFLKLSNSGNVIPVYKEINGDLDTPVSSFLRIQKGDYGFLLESVEGQEKVARYSFLGTDPSLIIRSKGRNITIADKHKHSVRTFITKSSPLDEVRAVMENFRAVTVRGLPRFYGGLVGYIGYDAVRFFEQIPDKNPDDLKMDDMVLMLTDSLFIFDHVNHSIKIVYNILLPQGKKITTADKIALYRRAERCIQVLERRFHATKYSIARKKSNQPRQALPRSNVTQKDFEAGVVKAKKYIREGDITQVVLSQRFSVAMREDNFSVYRKLRSLNPSPYMFFLKLKDSALIGSSPEMLVRCEDGLLQTRPIAGTRPRGDTDARDERMAKELLASPKERAEHLMLVDLGRNDLGRVSQAGTVEVNEFMKIERYSHVMHLVSEVRGKLDKRHYGIYDVLRSAFPAGTVSGSPKIRAMEIIDELENVRRGPYAGCVGYFSFSHNMDTCITIRTIVVKKGIAYVQAGAGIVADSVGRSEYIETVNKAKALLKALSG